MAKLPKGYTTVEHAGRMIVLPPGWEVLDNDVQTIADTVGKELWRQQIAGESTGITASTKLDPQGKIIIKGVLQAE